MKIVLKSLNQKLLERAITNETKRIKKQTSGPTTEKKQQNSLVFTTKYFQEVKSLKSLVRNLESDIKELCGDIRIIFALKKNPSVANKVVKNRMLSEVTVPLSSESRTTQSCGAKKCMLCPLLMGLDEKIIVNGIDMILDPKLNCKSNNCIYIAICKICDKSNSYIGQTVNAVHIRFNGHRADFKIDENKTYEKSALSEHCYDKHRDSFDLKYFKIGIIKACSVSNLDRLEDSMITKYRTNIWGLNRMKVIN